MDMMEGRPDPVRYSQPSAEVQPHAAKLYLLEITQQEGGRQRFELMLADYFVGKPTGYGVPFILEECREGYGQMRASLYGNHASPQVVPPTATLISLLHLPDSLPEVAAGATQEQRELAAVDALLPKVARPDSVVVRSIYSDRIVFAEFWYRDAQGSVRSGRCELVPHLTETEYNTVASVLWPLHLVWTIPVDVVIVAGMVVIAPFFILAM